MTIEVVRSPLLAGVPHGFLGRTGGVSTGEVAGLNVGLGSRDDPIVVAENRRRAVNAVLPLASLVTAFQVHSAEVVVVTAAWPDNARPHADALVTERPGLALGILTADCAPVLLADRKAGVVGAAHAGWKGAFSGVIDATINAMERLGGKRSRIVGAIGPCIAQQSYEVDDAFRARFMSSDRDTEVFFSAGRAGHAFFNLEGYVAHRLQAAGINHIDRAGEDTLAQPARFYSFRRATLAKESDYGRQISIIALGE